MVPLRSVMLLLAGCWLVRRRTKKDVADKMCGKFEFMLLCFLFGMGRKDLGPDEDNDHADDAQRNESVQLTKGDMQD